jgi:hypothetical protein
LALQKRIQFNRAANKKERMGRVQEELKTLY